MHKYNDEFTKPYSLFFEGWEIELYRKQLPKQVASTISKASKLPRYSLEADHEVLDSLGIKDYLPSDDESIVSPRASEKCKKTELPVGTEIKEESKDHDIVNLRGTARKKAAAKKDLQEPYDPLFKTEICKQWKDGKVTT
jgi:hypothetical protein